MAALFWNLEVVASPPRRGPEIGEFLLSALLLRDS